HQNERGGDGEEIPQGRDLPSRLKPHEVRRKSGNGLVAMLWNRIDRVIDDASESCGEIRSGGSEACSLTTLVRQPQVFQTLCSNRVRDREEVVEQHAHAVDIA